MNNQIIQEIRSLFKKKYNAEPIVVRSPGRVNLIGEHTDYNEGFVLPAAIDKAIYVGISKRNDDVISLYSKEFEEQHDVKVSDVAKAEKHWANYVLGVVDQLQKRGYKVEGFNLMLDGDVPIGSGLSSSAAVECATAYALNEWFQFKIEKKELAFIAQKAEHEFAGVLCGIMDQFASVFGKKNHVIQLDCRSLEYQYVPIDLKGYKIVLLNTNVKHSLASSEYNTRHNECIEGVEMVKQKYSEVKSLRDVTMEMLQETVQEKNETIYKRCKYVVEENQRLLEACEALKEGNLQTFGQKMFASHDGLSKEYEVSCKELDFLVDSVRENENVIGARMMGGGFGGCTINLIKEEAIDELVQNVGRKYLKEMKKEMTTYVAQTEDGTSIVE